MGMGAEGLAVPTAVHGAPAPTDGLDCSVPPVGLQEMTTLPPEMLALSLVGPALVLATNELL